MTGDLRLSAMFGRLRGRRWLCALVALMLAAGQVAAAAYACPGVRPVEAAAPSLPPCHGGSHAAMDPESPLLCKAHCEAGAQTVSGQAPAVAAPALIDTLAMRGLDALVSIAASALAAPAERSAGPPRGAPPIYLLLHALRR